MDTTCSLRQDCQAVATPLSTYQPELREYFTPRFLSAHVTLFRRESRTFVSKDLFLLPFRISLYEMLISSLNELQTSFRFVKGGSRRHFPRVDSRDMAPPTGDYASFSARLFLG